MQGQLFCVNISIQEYNSGTKCFGMAAGLRSLGVCSVITVHREAPLTSFAHLMCRGWHHDLVTGLSPVQACEMELSVKPAVQITMVR